MSTETLDLRGVKCPLSWARAKVRLDEMRRGDRLLLLLDEERALRDIPQAAEAAGHAVAEVELDRSGFWTLEIEA